MLNNFVFPSVTTFALLLLTTTCLGFDNNGAFVKIHHRPTASSFRHFNPIKINCFHHRVVKRSNLLKRHSQSDDQEEPQLHNTDIQGRSNQDRSYENFGVLTPIAEILDNLSGDWALSYADLSPSTPKTIEGQAFLATNVAYIVCGIIVGSQGDWFFAGLVELAGIVSFWYHFIQLDFGKDRYEVRLALLTDYFTAGAALLTGGYYMVDMGISSLPFDALLSGGLAIACLSLCWVWEFGYPYLFWHSLWHLGSAYTAYLIGQTHLGRG